MIQFLDETGSPLAGGFGVTVTSSGATISGTTDSTGSIPATLASGVLYAAAFTGPGAPTETPSFYGNTDGSHLTDDSGNVITTDAGDAILVDDPTQPTVVTIEGYAPTVNLRVSQVGVEWARSNGKPNLRLSQLGMEYALRRGSPKVRLSQAGIEYALQLAPSALRVTQVGIEFAARVAYTIEVEPANTSTSSTGNVQYRAILYANGNRVGPVPATWAAEGGTGSIDPNTGLFTAQTPGTGTITATAPDTAP